MDPLSPVAESFLLFSPILKVEHPVHKFDPSSHSYDACGVVLAGETDEASLLSHIQEPRRRYFVQLQLR